MLQYYLAGWHIKPKGVKKPWVLRFPLHLISFRTLFRRKHRYNPVLGEFFRCRYDYADGTQGFYIAEQGKSAVHTQPRTYHVPCTAFDHLTSFDVSIVSHHPPISAFFYISPQNHVCILGELRPKSKFLGNSVSTTMEGENRVSLLGRPEDGGTRTHILFLITGELNSMICWSHDVGSPRIYHYYAQHVRPRHSIREDGA